MRMTALALISLAPLLSGCWGLSRDKATLPDPSIPHEVAKETTVTVWARQADGTLTPEVVRLPAGYWIYDPHLLQINHPAPKAAP